MYSSSRKLHMESYICKLKYFWAKLLKSFKPTTLGPHFRRLFRHLPLHNFDRARRLNKRLKWCINVVGIAIPHISIIICVCLMSSPNVFRENGNRFEEKRISKFLSTKCSIENLPLLSTKSPKISFSKKFHV